MELENKRAAFLIGKLNYNFLTISKHLMFEKCTTKQIENKFITTILINGFHNGKLFRKLVQIDLTKLIF